MQSEENEVSKDFLMGRGVRQSSPLSPSLFNLLIADLEGLFKKREVGRGKSKGREILYAGVCG